MKNEKTISGFPFTRYEADTFTPGELLSRSREFRTTMSKRRCIRDFSDRPVSREVIENILSIASSAPSGAHRQPWTFCVVSNPEIKRQIRTEAEKEEYHNYHGRMSDEWLEALKPLQTNWEKPFLETAPYLIVVFKKVFDLNDDGSKANNYYVNESVGIASGFLIAAIHQSGLGALVHTPSPMNFLAKVLNRPDHERAFLLIPVGYPADEVYVPSLERKPIEEVAVFYD